MANPVFITVMASGAVHASIDPNFTPSGTVAAVYKVSGAVSTQQLGTISGVAGSYAATNGVTNKHSGKEST